MRARLRGTRALAIAATALVLAGTAAAAVLPLTSNDAAPTPLPLADRVGVNVPNVATTGVPATYGRTILADDGIRLFRDTLDPSNTFPSARKGPNWTYVDRTVRFVKNVPGGQLLPLIVDSPRWQHRGCKARPSYKCAPDRAHYRTWANEVKRIIRHVTAAGVAVPEIEYWNEPYCCGFWLPRSSPAAYVALLRTLAPTLWAAYPKLKIAVSANYWQEGKTCSARPCPQWFRRVLAADKTGLLDDPRIVFTTHNYVLAAPPSAVLATGWSFDRYRVARDQAVRHGKVDPRFEITEYGWEASSGTVVFGDPVSEEQQALYTTQAAHLALTDPCACVDRVFVFDDYKGHSRLGNAHGYNMHRPDGTARPVAAAVKAYIRAGTP